MDRKKISHVIMILAVFATALATSTSALAAVPQNCTKIHTVQKGEYLSQIARKYDVSWKWLADINNLANPSKIYPGQQICVALGDGSNNDGVCTKYHTVKRGEYLVQIARLYGVSWRWLADINNLANPSRIYPGQKLCVEVSNEGNQPFTCTQYYTVVKGDYLSKIAKRFNVSWQWLADINDLVNPSRIYPGQVLCVATG